MIPLRDSIPTRHTPWVTFGIIGTGLLVFVLEFISPDLDSMILQYALIPSFIDWSNPYSLIPFITALFLHAGFIHVVSNMWFLWIFGNNVENYFGSIKFLFLYLLFGVLANFAQYILSVSSDIPMLGASGAIAGVLGAYLVLFPYAKVEVLIPYFGLPMTVKVPAPFMLIYWFLIQLLSGFASFAVETASTGGVAWWAHVGGFIGGFFAAKIVPGRKWYQQPE